MIHKTLNIPNRTTHTAKLIYLYLRKRAIFKRTMVSRKTISNQLGISPSTVSKGIKYLKQQGYITVQPTHLKNGLRSINIYRIEV